MLAKKRLDEWAPQIDEILSDAKHEIRQRFGEFDQKLNQFRVY